MNIFIYIYIHINVYTCLHVCIYIYICISLSLSLSLNLSAWHLAVSRLEQAVCRFRSFSRAGISQQIKNQFEADPGGSIERNRCPGGGGTLSKSDVMINSCIHHVVYIYIHTYIYIYRDACMYICNTYTQQDMQTIFYNHMRHVIIFQLVASVSLAGLLLQGPLLLFSWHEEETFWTLQEGFTPWHIHLWGGRALFVN